MSKFRDGVVAAATVFEDFVVTPIVKRVEGIVERNSGEIKAAETELVEAAEHAGHEALIAAAPILDKDVAQAVDTAIAAAGTVAEAQAPMLAPAIAAGTAAAQAAADKAIAAGVEQLEQRAV